MKEDKLKQFIKENQEGSIVFFDLHCGEEAKDIDPEEWIEEHGIGITVVEEECQ